MHIIYFLLPKNFKKLTFLCRRPARLPFPLRPGRLHCAPVRQLGATPQRGCRAGGHKFRDKGFTCGWWLFFSSKLTKFSSELIHFCLRAFSFSIHFDIWTSAMSRKSSQAIAVNDVRCQAWWVPVATYLPACLCLFCLSFQKQPKTASDDSQAIGGWLVVLEVDVPYTVPCLVQSVQESRH